MLKRKQDQKAEKLKQIEFMFLNDFFNEKSEQKAEALTLEQARKVYPKLFNVSLCGKTRLKPSGSSDCF